MLDTLYNLMLVFSNVVFFACYIGSCGTFPKPLDSQEEQEYVRKMNEGDMQAKNVLIERNLRLVAHVIKKYMPPGSKEAEDLISIGTIGLIKGITSFNNSRDTKLATYVARCIDNEILMHMRKQKRSHGDVSLHEPIGTDREGNEITLFDVIEDDGETVDEKVELRMKIRKLYEKMICVLHSREIQIISWRFGLGDGLVKTQHEIAKMLGISRSYVSRIEKRALEKLQKSLEFLVEE